MRDTGPGPMWYRPGANVTPARGQCDTGPKPMWHRPETNVIPARSQCDTGPKLIILAPAGWRCNSGAAGFRFLYRFAGFYDMQIPEKRYATTQKTIFGRKKIKRWHRFKKYLFGNQNIFIAWVATTNGAKHTFYCVLQCLDAFCQFGVKA